MPSTYRRLKVLVDHRLQFRLTGWLALVTLGALVFQAGLYLSHMAALTVDAPEDPSLAFERVIEGGTNVLLLSVGVVLPLMVVVGTLTTFRVAGPLLRIKRYLRQINEGGSPPDCKLREGDELMELCDLINRVTAEQRQRNAQATGDVTREAA